jgi:hypothetical protein
MGYGSLASTGVSISIFGVVLDQMQVVGIAAGLVLAGALLIRFGFRRGKSPQEV